MACLKNGHEMSGFIDTFSYLLLYSYKSYSLSGYMHALLKTSKYGYKENTRRVIQHREKLRKCWLSQELSFA